MLNHTVVDIFYHRGPGANKQKSYNLSPEQTERDMILKLNHGVFCSRSLPFIYLFIFVVSYRFRLSLSQIRTRLQMFGNQGKFPGVRACVADTIRNEGMIDIIRELYYFVFLLVRTFQVRTIFNKICLVQNKKNTVWFTRDIAGFNHNA